MRANFAPHCDKRVLICESKLRARFLVCYKISLALCVFTTAKRQITSRPKWGKRHSDALALASHFAFLPLSNADSITAKNHKTARGPVYRLPLGALKALRTLVCPVGLDGLAALVALASFFALSALCSRYFTLGFGFFHKKPYLCKVPQGGRHILLMKVY